MKRLVLNVEPRTVTGRKVKKMRTDGLVPGVMYGRGYEPISVQAKNKEFETVFSEAGTSTLVNVQMQKDSYPAIIQDVVRHPVDGTVMHADFYRVRLDEKITADITLVFTGESSSVKNDGGILVKNMKTLEVEGLPQDLPHEIVVDITSLAKFEDHIQVKDLSLPSGIEASANAEDIVALIQAPMSEDELKAALEGTSTDVSDVQVGEEKEESAEEGEEAPAEEAKKEE